MACPCFCDPVDSMPHTEDPTAVLKRKKQERRKTDHMLPALNYNRQSVADYGPKYQNITHILTMWPLSPVLIRYLLFLCGKYLYILPSFQCSILVMTCRDHILYVQSICGVMILLQRRRITVIFILWWLLYTSIRQCGIDKISSVQI